MNSPLPWYRSSRRIRPRTTELLGISTLPLRATSPAVWPSIGGDVAVFATARELATLIYRLLRRGQQYVDEGAEAYEKRYQAIRITTLGIPTKANAVPEGSRTAIRGSSERPSERSDAGFLIVQ